MEIPFGGSFVSLGEVMVVTVDLASKYIASGYYLSHLYIKNFISTAATIVNQVV